MQHGSLISFARRAAGCAFATLIASCTLSLVGCDSSPDPMAWCEVLVAEPDPAVVTDSATRSRISATKLPWKVRDRKTGMIMLLVPPGDFEMGSPPDEPRRGTNEHQHHASISKAFYLGQTEVTQDEWKRMRGGNPAQFTGGENPVEQVSWNDCQAFCSSAGMRLPTEVEWEYACRAGTQTPYFSGAASNPDEINYDGSLPYGGGPKGVYRERTVECGSLPHNPWGFREMHGNVWEWCQDAFEIEAARVQSGREGTGQRVVRGGSWYDDAINCRSASRLEMSPGYTSNLIGFRAARTPG
jgi:formylglycine-generating enzyme required for sulfatase activity